MTPYSSIFSRFLGRIDSYSLASLNRNNFYELSLEWLKAAITNVEIRQLFTSISLDDEVQELFFELEDSIDEKSDERFVIEIIALGMEIAWLNQRVDSELYTAPFIGGKEEKKILDGHSAMSSRLNTLELQLHKKIAKHGYFNGNVGGR